MKMKWSDLILSQKKKRLSEKNVARAYIYNIDEAMLEYLQSK